MAAMILIQCEGLSMLGSENRIISENLSMDEKIESAVIVAAHPDDEILWFSSIIEKVEKVIICYVYQESMPEWSRGRIAVLDNYPLTHLHSIKLHLADVFDCGDWHSPVVTPFGMEICGKGCNRQKYEDNYRRLESELLVLLRPYKNVFTHNPWGEYGHEEHVQVFRVVDNLRKRLEFTLWVPNYVSNRSMPFMANSIKWIGNEYFCKSTNMPRATRIKDLYQRFRCWTWYSDYKWPDEDVFFRVNAKDDSLHNSGASYPITYIQIEEAVPAHRSKKTTEKLITKMRRYSNRMFRK